MIYPTIYLCIDLEIDRLKLDDSICTYDLKTRSTRPEMFRKYMRKMHCDGQGAVRIPIFTLNESLSDGKLGLLKPFHG